MPPLCPAAAQGAAAAGRAHPRPESVNPAARSVLGLECALHVCASWQNRETIPQGFRRGNEEATDDAPAPKDVGLRAPSARARCCGERVTAAWRTGAGVLETCRQPGVLSTCLCALRSGRPTAPLPFVHISRRNPQAAGRYTQVFPHLWTTRRPLFPAGFWPLCHQEEDGRWGAKPTYCRSALSTGMPL